MLKPINGVQSVLPLLDHIVERRPYLPPLVVGLTSPDGVEARAFVDGYRERLFDIKNHSLVPNAHAGGATLQIAHASKTSPDVGLLDEIAKHLRSTIPVGAGKHWQPKQFAICLDVVTAAGKIDTTTSDATREALYEWLYSRWEKRKKLLSWTRAMSHAEQPSKILGLILTALLHGPSRWFFGRRLNRSGLRWFGEHVKGATGRDGDFLDQAVYLLPDSGLQDVTALHRRILFDALLHDVARYTRRQRFLPHRRRRRWTPVLLLDATDPLAASLVDLYSELTSSAKVMPLLVIAAVNENATTGAAVHDIDEAGPTLRALVEQEEILPQRRLVLRLPKDPPEDSAASNHILTHRRVTPKIPGGVSAFAPLALTVLLVVGSAGLGVYQYLGSGCADTRTNALGERVGVIESGCSFGQSASTTAGVPNLTELEQQVFANNKAVDEIMVGNLKQYHREVVFFAPLTRPKNAVGATAPPNAIWQLRGAVVAQQEHNEKATRDANLVPIKLVLANSGDKFSDGDWVAGKIAERPQSGDGDLAAVIGVSQSRPVVADAIRDHLRDIPVVGASMYGSKMTEGNAKMFLSAPLNEAFATKMAEWLDGSVASVIYDPDDEYFSRELHDKLRDKGVGSRETDVEIRENDTTNTIDARIKTICDNNRTPVLANRADEILKFLDRAASIDSCRDVRILGGPGMIVEAAKGKLADQYPWASLTLACLGEAAVASEESTGRDAFRIAAAGITEAQSSAKGVWQPALVQTMLLKSEIYEVSGLPKPNDPTATNRIWLIPLK